MPFNRFILSLFFTAGLIWACTQQKVSPPQAISPVPTPTQLAWHDMELNAFVHFGINTFTDKEWGYGDENENFFNPTQCSPSQWVSVLKEAGFKGLILTCKHHDGFCLWPSKFTEHSIKNAPWKNGKGDLVREVAEACKQEGLKFGIYLSPWDRHHKDYGSPAYIEYYRHQLNELFTLYPDVFEMWFDGANGGDGFYGGQRETRKINGRQYYDWPTTLSQVRQIDTSVLFFSDAGPDIRWAGNEKGNVSKTYWNTITPDTLYAGKAGIENLLNTGTENGTSWIPAECDVSIRPGWFYHAKEDSLVKTPEQLFDIYLKSVGRGSLLLLNIPPDKRGWFHENDIKSLRGFRKLFNEEFKKDLAQNAIVKTDTYRGHDDRFAPGALTDGNDETYWATDDDHLTGTIEINLAKKEKIKYVVLQEYIKLGQRIKHFSVEVWKNNKWEQVARETTIGRKRILKIVPVETNKIRVNILSAKTCPVISNIEIY
ncbi:MAG: alpha-L-fucosidase [Bacteroidetes bacterium]|nr:alpha-L-fucosidase [Bacteroidota bacterium]